MDRSAYDLIYSVVMAIPRGCVATYGQVAAVAGLPGRARLVGRAMKTLPEDSAVPWHRVINASGGISERAFRDSVAEQRILLEDEGVVFDAAGRVPLARYRWDS